MRATFSPPPEWWKPFDSHEWDLKFSLRSLRGRGKMPCVTYESSRLYIFLIELTRFPITSQLKFCFFFDFKWHSDSIQFVCRTFFMTQKLKFCSFDCLAMCGGWFTNYFNARVSNWVSWNAKLLSRDWDQVMSLLNHQLELPYAQICRNLRFEIFFFSPTF